MIISFTEKGKLGGNQMKHTIRFKDEYTIDRKENKMMYKDTYIFSGNATIEVNSCYKDGYLEEFTKIEENSKKAITDIIKAGIIINKDEFFTNETLLKDYIKASANRNKAQITDCQITKVTKETTCPNSVWVRDLTPNEKER